MGNLLEIQKFRNYQDLNLKNSMFPFAGKSTETGYKDKEVKNGRFLNHLDTRR